jgi:SUMO ligase MMS21 Smc5/6 complex component
MINSLFHISSAAIILERAIADVTKSIALDQHLLQKARHISENIRDFESVNGSVNGIIRKVTQLQMLMQKKLQNIEKLLQRLENFYIINYPEEAVERKEDSDGDEALEE